MTTDSQRAFLRVPTSQLPRSIYSMQFFGLAWTSLDKPLKMKTCLLDIWQREVLARGLSNGETYYHVIVFRSRISQRVVARPLLLGIVRPPATKIKLSLRRVIGALNLAYLILATSAKLKSVSMRRVAFYALSKWTPPMMKMRPFSVWTVENADGKMVWVLRRSLEKLYYLKSSK